MKRNFESTSSYEPSGPPVSVGRHASPYGLAPVGDYAEDRQDRQECFAASLGGTVASSISSGSGVSMGKRTAPLPPLNNMNTSLSALRKRKSRYCHFKKKNYKNKKKKILFDRVDSLLDQLYVYVTLRYVTLRSVQGNGRNVPISLIGGFHQPASFKLIVLILSFSLFSLSFYYLHLFISLSRVTSLV